MPKEDILAGGKSRKEWNDIYQQRLLEWQRVYAYGNVDQMWTDGVSLRLIRQELLEIQRILSTFGEAVTVPEEVPEGFMANAGAIQKCAEESLKKYLGSEDYLYLCRMEGQLTAMQRRKTQCSLALGNVRNLEQAVRSGNLVVMREFGADGQFDRILSETAAHVKKLPAVKTKGKEKIKGSPAEEMDWQIEGQMSIYDLAS